MAHRTTDNVGLRIESPGSSASCRFTRIARTSPPDRWLSGGRVEELDRIAIRILQMNLLAAGSGFDLVAEDDALPLQCSDTDDKSSTSRAIRFQPPGSWVRASGMGREPELPGPLSHKARLSFDT